MKFDRFNSINFPKKLLSAACSEDILSQLVLEKLRSQVITMLSQK